MQAVIKVFQDEGEQGEQVIDEDPLFEERFDGDQPIITFGSAASNDVVLKHDLVSRYHAALVRHPENCEFAFLRDLSSLNGTAAGPERLAFSQATVEPARRIYIRPFRIDINLLGPEDDPWNRLVYGDSGYVYSAASAEEKARGTAPAKTMQRPTGGGGFSDLAKSLASDPKRQELLNQFRLQLARQPDRASMLEWLVRNAKASLKADKSLARFAHAGTRLVFPPNPKGPKVRAPAAALHAVPNGKFVVEADAMTIPLLQSDRTVGDWTLNRDPAQHGSFTEEDASFLLALAACAIDTCPDKVARQQDGYAEAMAWPVDIVGASPAFRQLEQQVRLAGMVDKTSRILLRGPTGVGKTFVAREIHRLSGRPKNRIGSANCATGDPLALEFQLFGGSGRLLASRGESPGLFEETDGGTVFLDEIADMSDRVQAMLKASTSDLNTTKMLVNRINENRQREVDVRLICGTNADLDALVAAGKFRADLLHRLRGKTIAVPPLKERSGDVPLLAYFFLDQIAAADHQHLSPSPGRQ